MSRIHQDASPTADDTGAAGADRHQHGRLDDRNAGDGTRSDDASTPTVPSDAAPTPAGHAPGHHEPDESVAEAFGIDEKNLYHERTDD